MGRWLGMAMGLPDMSIFLDFTLGLWYGASLVRSGEINTGDILIALFSSMLAFMVCGPNTRTRRYPSPL
jgi:hypothetical protein